MKSLYKTTVVACSLALLTSASAFSAPAKPKAKTPPKAKAPVHTTIGTTQLSGENAQFGITYTLGKTDPMNITIRSASYSVDPILIGDVLHTVSSDEKFLVLHMTYHNPQPNDKYVRWDNYGYTVVDPHDENHDGLIDLGAEGETTAVSMSMKPAQKKDVFAAIIVPAASEMPKLIIKGSDERVLRYDLRGKVKPLPATYADPADKSGATALAKIKGLPDTPYAIGRFQFKFVKASLFTGAKLGEYDRDGEKFVLVQFVLKNMSPSKEYFRWDTLANTLMDVDGGEICSSTDVFTATRTTSYSADMSPAQETTFRYLYKMASDVVPKTLKISQEHTRAVEFDIPELK
ncbi:MAG TPA: hypothetical protein VGK19_10640 [Capsulimonadaceae bacterium]|jgi:hypothetical protein